MESADLNIGDVISMKGSGVPRELERAYWKVVAFWEPTERATGTYALDGPYSDEHCKIRFNNQNGKK